MFKFSPNSGKVEFSKMLEINHFFQNRHESDTSKFYRTGQTLVCGNTAKCGSGVAIPSHAIIYLVKLSCLTIKVRLASERKVILSYFSYNPWTAAIRKWGALY